MKSLKLIILYTFSQIIHLLVIFNKSGVGILSKVTSTVSAFSDNYCFYKLSPKSSDTINKSKILTSSSKGELAIILQGLPELKDDFTLETIRIYKKMFPNQHIIVSTWDSVDKDLLSKFENEGCVVVVSKTFPECGFGNVNYQIHTTYQGLLKAKELGAKYAIKCRSDLRILRDFSFEYLKSLLVMLPVADQKLKTTGRIVSLSAGVGQLFYPNWIQDYFYFGYTDDLINLFNIPRSTRNIPSSAKYLRETYHPCSAADMCKEEVAEIYIIRRFLEKYIVVEDSVGAWWNLLMKYFIIIGFDELNAFWFKYNQWSMNFRLCDYNGKTAFPDEMRNISFQTFLSMVNGMIIYEPWMENCREKLIIFNDDES